MADELGEAIRRMRKLKRWNQTKLGQKAGTNKDTISKIERGEGNPLHATLEAIAKALGTTLAELSRRDAAPGKVDSESSHIDNQTTRGAPAPDVPTEGGEPMNDPRRRLHSLIDSFDEVELPAVLRTLRELTGHLAAGRETKPKSEGDH